MAVMLACVFTFAQDVITKRNGEDINAKILEVNQNDIKYKKADNLNGPTFTISKSDILMVRYENGSKDIFNQTTTARETSSVRNDTAPREQAVRSERIRAERPAMVYNNWQFHVGVAFPTGDFGDEKKGGAGTGFNVGVKYFYPINALEGLLLTFSGDVYFNQLNSDIRDGIKKEYEDDDYDDYDDWSYRIPKYFNIPLTVGANYQYNINNDIAIFGEAGLGLNLSKMTKWKEWTEEDGYEETYMEKAKLSTKFCYRLEAGFLFQNKYSLSVKYNGLGSHKYKMTESWEDSDGDEEEDTYTFDKALKITNVSLAFGIRF